MDIRLDRDALARALQLASPLIDTRPTLPILAHALFETVEGGLRLAATDLETGVSVTVPAEIRQAGAFAIPARPLVELVHTLPAGPVTLAACEPNSIRLTSGSTTVRLARLAAEDFPAFEGPQDGREITLDAGQLQTMLTQCAYAASRDEHRVALGGIFVSITAEELRLVATDGHRLALSRQAIAPGEAISGIVPRKAAEAMRRLLSGQETATLNLGTRQASLSAGPVRLVSRLLEGLFPNYEQVFPQEFTTRLVFDREAMGAALRQVAVMAESQTRAVRLAIREGTVHLTASSPDAGEAEATVPAEGAEANTETALTIRFNARYLLEALAPMEGDRAIMELNNANNPAVLSSLTNERYRCVVMPLTL